MEPVELHVASRDKFLVRFDASRCPVDMLLASEETVLVRERQGRTLAVRRIDPDACRLMPTPRRRESPRDPGPVLAGAHDLHVRVRRRVRLSLVDHIGEGRTIVVRCEDGPIFEVRALDPSRPAGKRA